MGTTDDRQDPRLSHLRSDGQQEAYLILSDEERAKGFVEPVRLAYKHVGTEGTEDEDGRPGCGVVTTMGRAIAETYARNPEFYTGTFCVGCGTHKPVGAQGEFVWDGTDQRVGTRREA